MDVEENIRIGRNKIEKRHFKFKYRSPLRGRDVTILLDVVFENIHYGTTIEVPIENELLLTEGENLFVKIPDANNILGDKLTAFAPHTTGVHLGEGKDLEIVKQLFDCSALIDDMDSYSEVCDAYDKTVEAQLAYRGLSILKKEVLEDTIKASICIASRGQVYGEEYSYYIDGISRIRNHVIGGKFTGETAGACAGKVLYLSSSMLVGSDIVQKINDVSLYMNQKIELPKPRSFSYLRIVDPIAYGCIVKSSKMLREILKLKP